MSAFDVKPLDPSTWQAFAGLVEAHHGVWGGCWCMGFHAKGEGWGKSAALNRRDKEALVRQGRAHAALVFAGGECVGWCQYGSTDELPRIKNRSAYMASDPVLPDWRITCFFSGKGHRGEGVAAVALAGALDLIRGQGGGRVEGYPEDTEGRKVSGSFLFNGALSMFERQGFGRTRLIGKNKWVVTRIVS
ncbi:MAG: GNAT family N-acetyltransferase [Tabrizicola sp.]|nr:GNAT family N-acetyltransferase [Tabrizicola sp.]